MSARHDGLFEALTALQARIAARDALGAEAAMEVALARFAAVPTPGDDERLLPLKDACEAAARLYCAELGGALRETAAGARATEAYGRGAQP
jgi:hypothetical protein